MTDSNKTHVTIVVDRSGSMSSVQQEAEAAVNAYVNDQKGGEGNLTLTLREFDTFHNVVFDGDINDAPNYKLTPRGMTALYDAVGIAINETGTKLRNLPEGERPGKVLLVIQTDGGENSSHEFQLDVLKKLIKQQEDEYSWEFVFLGMGLGVANQGFAMGIRNTTVVPAGTGVAYASAWNNVSQHTTSYRDGTAKSMAGTQVEVDEDGNIITPT